MWEYVTIWHQAKWIKSDKPPYNWLMLSRWEKWVTSPGDAEGPPPDASDSAALNFMGQRGWELIETDKVLDSPDGTNSSSGAQRRQYLFKRPLAR